MLSTRARLCRLRARLWAEGADFLPGVLPDATIGVPRWTVQRGRRRGRDLRRLAVTIAVGPRGALPIRRSRRAQPLAPIRRWATSSASPKLESGMTDDALTVLVYSDDRNTRDQVRMALGRRPASDLPRVEFVDVATDWAVHRPHP